MTSQGIDGTGDSPPGTPGRARSARGKTGQLRSAAGRLDPASGVELAEAIEALRRTLERTHRDAQQPGVRFEAELVELTVRVELARNGSEPPEIQWRVLGINEPSSPQRGGPQTLTIRFAPRADEAAVEPDDTNEALRLPPSPWVSRLPVRPLP